MTEVGKTLRVVIVDDEEPARMALRAELAIMPDVTIAGECAHGFDAVKTVAEVRPDVVLLDVQMPKLDGFEVLELIGSDVPVVFVTAYDEFALKAFEVHGVVPGARTRPACGALHERAAGQRQKARRVSRAGSHPRRRARPRRAGGQDRLRRGAGRLCGVSNGREAAPQRADHGRRRVVARPEAFRAHPPLVPAERRPPCEG